MTFLDRVRALNDRLTEFAYGDNIIEQYRNGGSSPRSIADALAHRQKRASVMRAARAYLPLTDGVRARNRAAVAISDGFNSSNVARQVAAGNGHPIDHAIDRVLKRKG